jgi:hypothetical protein
MPLTVKVVLTAIAVLTLVGPPTMGVGVFLRSEGLFAAGVGCLVGVMAITGGLLVGLLVMMWKEI